MNDFFLLRHDGNGRWDSAARPLGRGRESRLAQPMRSTSFVYRAGLQHSEQGIQDDLIRILPVFPSALQTEASDKV